MLKRDFLWLSVIVVSGTGGVIVACGSDNTGLDLLAPPDASVEASSSGTSSSSSTSSSSGSSGNPLNDGGQLADDAGHSTDGGIDPPGAGPGGNTTTITCGATTCSIPAETCCVSQLQSAGSKSFACVSGAACPAPAGGGDTVALKCSSQANCAPGTVCCVSVVANGDNAASECKVSCTGDQAQLCDPTAGAASGCPQSAPCSNHNIGDWRLPSTFATCGGKGN